ncbi:MAG: hypothetical protein U5J98_05045 [Halobacteriales archaeon]|nr:hypothetical protein [Halobacteriales archaeon]
MAAESGGASVTARDVLEEGGRIIAILVFWGLLAALARYGVGNIGLARPGHLFFELGRNLAIIFVVTGLASVLLFVIARGIQLSGESHPVER